MKSVCNIVVVFAVFALFPLSRLAAQDQSVHEFTINGGFGQYGLKADLKAGDSKQKLGGSLGLGYSYFFNELFSINTGIEVSLYRAELEVSSFKDNFNTTDNSGTNFELRSQINNYGERQHAYFLNIPVMAQFQFPVKGENLFYVGAGFKIGFPLSAKYRSSGYALTTAGYYPGVEEPIVNDPALGLGNFAVGKIKKNLGLDAAFMLSAEMGMKWYLSFDHSLYTGVFIDYGLNDIRKESNAPFLSYNKQYPGNYSNNTIVNTQLSDKLIPMSVGIKVRLAFKFD